MTLLGLICPEEVLVPIRKRTPGDVQDGVNETLKAFGHLDPNEEHLVVSGELLKQLKVHVGKISTAKELVGKLEAGVLTPIRGDYKGAFLDLNPGQKKYIRERAQIEKISEPEALEKIIIRALAKEIPSY